MSSLMFDSKRIEKFIFRPEFEHMSFSLIMETVETWDKGRLIRDNTLYSNTFYIKSYFRVIES